MFHDILSVIFLFFENPEYKTNLKLRIIKIYFLKTYLDYFLNNCGNCSEEKEKGRDTREYGTLTC